MCSSHYQRWVRANRPGVFLGVEVPEAKTGGLAPWEWNPWLNVAPLCPACGTSARVYLWANEGELRWYCAGCCKRFDAAEEQAA
jgi:hypothetical protein